MYLSRLILDVRQPRVRHDLSDVYRLHRTILSAFPQAPDNVPARAHFGILYRIEPISGMPWLARLLVQSREQPDWSRIPDCMFGPALDERGNPTLRRIDDEYARIRSGMQFLFRLRANPTRRLSNRNAARDDRLLGKRVALVREEEQIAWLARKGEQHGFRLLRTSRDPESLAVRAAKQADEHGWRNVTQTQTMRLTFGAVLFTGYLTVTDADRFRTALEHGIGSGKAFGFGLLSIAAQ